MLNFESDYIHGCHPKVLENLAATNLEPQSGYGMDAYTASAIEKIRNIFGCPQGEVYFLSGGTQTNAFVISAGLKMFEGVIAADTGHIATHESGAIEYTGHKVITLKGEKGKLRADRIRDFLVTFYKDGNRAHMVKPGMVYISQPTEYGTLYTKEEMAAIHAVCTDYDMPLYVDGARLGYGLMSRESDIKAEDMAALCDIFYIGGTKVGALCGEALVYTGSPQGKKPEALDTLIKQHGALMAKGRLIGSQFDTLFTDNLYFAISQNAIDRAEELKTLLKSKGYEFFLETPTNQQFVVVANDKLESLNKVVKTCFWETVDETHTAVRFATCWATTTEDLDRLAAVLA